MCGKPVAMNTVIDTKRRRLYCLARNVEKEREENLARIGKNNCAWLKWANWNPADFEAIAKKMDGCHNNPDTSSTQKTQLHEACGFCYIVVRSDVRADIPVLYRGPDAAEEFINRLQVESGKIKERLNNIAPMDVSNEDCSRYNKAEVCHICRKPFKEGEKYCKKLDKIVKIGTAKVRDHCHITGKFRGAAHKSCILNFRFGSKISVIFHNLKGYDAHLIKLYFFYLGKFTI